MIACLKNEDALSPLLRRNAPNVVRPCLNNCDILVNHGVVVGGEADASNRKLSTNRAKQAGRPVDTKYRTDGLPACLRLLDRLRMVPMPPFANGWGTAASTVLFSLPKKIRGKC